MAAVLTGAALSVAERFQSTFIIPWFRRGAGRLAGASFGARWNGGRSTVAVEAGAFIFAWRRSRRP